MSNSKPKIFLLVLLSLLLFVNLACGTFQVGIVSSDDDLPMPIATDVASSDENIVFEPTRAPTRVTVSSQSAEPTAEIEVTGNNSDLPDDWTTYTNQFYGYKISYPQDAAVASLGPQGFSQNEIPEGMDPGEYMQQLVEKYSNELCMIIEYGSGVVSISAPPNQFYHYTNCNNPAPGAGEVVNKTETININGQQYQAAGFELVPGEGNPSGYFEKYSIELEDGTVISYGSAPGTVSDYQDYLINWKDVLLEIVQSYVDMDADISPTQGLNVPAGWSSYHQGDYNFLFYHPEDWEVTEGSHMLELTKDSLHLRIAYRSKEESISLWSGIWPAGSLPEGEEKVQGSIQFLGQSVSRIELIIDDQTAAVFYNAEEEVTTPFLDFAISLDSFSANGVGISQTDQDEVDTILETFAWIY